MGQNMDRVNVVQVYDFKEFSSYTLSHNTESIRNSPGKPYDSSPPLPHIRNVSRETINENKVNALRKFVFGVGRGF